jgi:anthranilate/para-aminobenzoate synthase component I
LAGDAFGDVEFAPVTSLPNGAPLELLAAIDAQRGTLDEDERIVFVLGYEACCVLAGVNVDVDERFGPQVFGLRGRVRARNIQATAAAPTLQLSTTPAAQAAHLARLHACRELLLDGVIYQANLAHRVDVEAIDHAGGVDFFLARCGQLACAALIDVPGFGSLVSLSPERFVVADLAAHTATTWPIKGTVPRGDDDDAALKKLRTSTKDQAEHVMIVDLLRNDLGRVATAGGVTVDSLMHAVSTSAVHHLETAISARLRDDVGVAELLVATAPGGSITGAPKSSAIEAIAQLEDGPRGPYTGVLGVVDGRGTLTTSLLIRTWLRADEGAGSLHVGGGIVVDSVANDEWQETLHKAAAFGRVSLR